jgi:hypothetical protein
VEDGFEEVKPFQATRDKWPIEVNLSKARVNKKTAEH